MAMQQLWGLQWGDKIVPISVSAARQAFVIGDGIQEQSDQQVIDSNEMWPVSQEFSFESYQHVARFLEIQLHKPSFRLRRPLMDGGNLRAAGAPEWAMEFINSVVITKKGGKQGERGDEEEEEGKIMKFQLGYASPLHSMNNAITAINAKSRKSNCDWDLIFELLKIADILHIDTLATLTAAKIASRLCGYTQHQLEAVFYHGKEYTPEEERRVRESESWAEKDPDLENELREEEEDAVSSSLSNSSSLQQQQQQQQ